MGFNRPKYQNKLVASPRETTDADKTQTNNFVPWYQNSEEK